MELFILYFFKLFILYFFKLFFFVVAKFNILILPSKERLFKTRQVKTSCMIRVSCFGPFSCGNMVAYIVGSRGASQLGGIF